MFGLYFIAFFVVKIERRGRSGHFGDIDKIGGARGKVRPENGMNAQKFLPSLHAYSEILNCLKRTPARRPNSYPERSGCAGRPTDLHSPPHVPKWLPTQRPTIRVRIAPLIFQGVVS